MATLRDFVLYTPAGSLFLWLFWPSFNAVLAADSARYRAVVNTYYSLIGSVIGTYFLSTLVNKGRKLDMVCGNNNADTVRMYVVESTAFVATSTCSVYNELGASIRT